MPLTAYVGLRTLPLVACIVFVLAALLPVQEANASSPDQVEIASRVDAPDRDDVQPLIPRPTLQVPRAARGLLIGGAAASLAGAAVAVFALTGSGTPGDMPTHLVTGVASHQTGPWLAGGLAGLFAGHLLMHLGVRRAKRDHANARRQFALRTQLGLSPQGFTVGVGARF